MKLKPILLFIILTWNITKSQNIKTYSGNYESGKATYQYFENSDYERIFNGTFTYSRANDYPAAYTSGRVSENIVITGTFKNNKKNGLWEAKKSFKSGLGSAIYGDLSVIQILKGNFNNGLKTGLWTYKETSVVNKKNESVNYQFNFSNNILVGDISTNNITGRFDETGKFLGTWSIKSDGTEYIAEFENNIFSKLIVRDVADGKIRMKYNFSNSALFDSNGVAIIDGKRFVLSDCTDLDKYENSVEAESSESDYNSKKNIYFIDFYKILSKKIGAYCCTTEYVELGSSPIPLYSPKVAIIKELSSQELQELKRKKDEELRLEKQRLDSIAKKEKVDLAISNGNKFFEEKKLKQALSEYRLANEIETTNDLREKIKMLDKEIDKIELLQEKRLNLYSYIKTNNDKIETQKNELLKSLQDKKKVYGVNYESCMNLLKVNFPIYFSKLNSFFLSNQTNGLKVEETWNETDQNALETLLKFDNEFKKYEKFHNDVKSAYENDNKDKLKLLKSSENPIEIISLFNQ